MQIGKSTVPLPVPAAGSSLARGASARQTLKATLSRSVSPADFQGRQRTLSAAARKTAQVRGREGLYAEVRSRLSDLRTAAASPALAHGVTQVSKPVYLSAIAGARVEADPNASLAELAAALGLATGGNGGFDIAVNGKAISLTGAQSIKDVVAAINASDAGADAAYDAASRRIELRNREAGTEAVSVQDLSGSLASTLGLTSDKRSELLNASNAGTGETRAVTTISAQARESLKAFTDDVDQLHALLEGATGSAGAYRDDPLLQDLADALKGITTPSADGAGKSLGDLGVLLKDGTLQLDEGRLTALATERPNQLASAWGVFFGEGGPALFKEGVQAIDDKSAQAPLEQRLAEQSVHVKAELARLGNKQRVLIQQQAAFEAQADSVKRQRESLNQIHDKLVDKLRHPGPEPIKVPPELLKEALALNLTPVAKPALPAPPQGGADAPALLSFGLGG